ncbi:MAG: hypothetical protein ACI8T1_000053 [Verrucomicrobiales bacterium]
MLVHCYDFEYSHRFLDTFNHRQSERTEAHRGSCNCARFRLVYSRMKHWLILLFFLGIGLGRAQQADQSYLARKDQLLQQRTQLNQTVWAQESEAQRHENSLVQLWDALLEINRQGKGDKATVFKSLGLSEVKLGTISKPRNLDHGISVVQLAAGKKLEIAAWHAWLDRITAEGYQLVQSEWHHATFSQDAKGVAKSTVNIVLHLTQKSTLTRLAIEGPISVTWAHENVKSPVPRAASVDCSGLRLLKRTGKPIFEKWFTLNPSKHNKPSGIHPLHVYDLDGDGKSEIIAAGCNTVIAQNDNGAFKTRTFLKHWERLHETGLLADANGDGHVDFLAPNGTGDMLLFPGSEKGLLDSKPLGKTKGGGPLQQPTALTAGDIDLDGDLDLWVGQYRISYVRGVMPTPYYDANDGLPAYLLLNEGGGKFIPWTPEAGLEKKRHRRSYTGTFVDLDDDRDLDLLVVSDFAGIDIYHNDGKGHFTDTTETTVDERHLFGMSATFGDYNTDGKLDFYVAGMGSTTARRLESMGAKRTDDPNVDRMRMTMAYGNRMYVGYGSGRYQQPTFKDQVARTGWAWGTTTLDFDNDGDDDLFVANGHSSGKSTKDHCTHFWCHDIYKPLSKPDRAMHEVFQEIHKGYFDKSESWDGYQKSHLIMNESEGHFTNIAFLMGVADEFDGRAALSDDLDGDGRMDLLVVEDRWHEGQLLHVYHNTLENDHHWIGVHLSEEGLHKSPLGARVELNTNRGMQTHAIVAGETIHAQHRPTAHFGLGRDTDVKSLRVIWPNGKERRLEKPEADRYHTIHPPAL